MNQQLYANPKVIGDQPQASFVQAAMRRLGIEGEFSVDRRSLSSRPNGNSHFCEIKSPIGFCFILPATFKGIVKNFPTVPFPRA